jgi:putative nucleotidyltransferase with HDIG domain
VFFVVACPAQRSTPDVTRNEVLDQIVAKSNDIPTLPATVLRVMQMIEDPLCSTADLAQVLQADPAMAAKILRLANSAYYGFRQKISNIPQAVTLLGFATLKNALLSAAVFDLFRLSAATNFDMVALWKHSVATATAAKLVANRVRFPNAEKAYTAGLMHDIGKIMIARYLPSSLATIVQIVSTEGLDMQEAELRTLGLAHPAFGAWVMGRWSLPQTLIEAVEFHHHPMHAQYAFDLAAIVNLADVLTHRAAIGSGGDTLIREVDPAVLDFFGLNETGLRDLQDALVFKRLEIESFAAVASTR